MSTVISAVPSAAVSPTRWAALIVALSGIFMDMLDTTIINVALPSIQRSFRADAAGLTWMVAAYTLAFALVLTTGGRLGDIYGRRRVFVVGVSGFALASAFSGLATGAATLIASRALQGVMAALMVPQVMSFIQADFPDGEKQAAFGAFGMTFALGAVAGPLVGGLLLRADLFGLGWRPLFLVNAPLGLVAAVLMAGIARESRSGNTTRIDPAGMAIGALAVLAFLYPLLRANELGWPAWTFFCMASSVPLAVLFVAYERAKERRDESPLVPITLFRHRSVVGGILVAVIFFAGTGYLFPLTLYLQEGLHYSPLHTALTFLPGSFGIILGSVTGVRIAPKLGRRIIWISSSAMIAGLALLIGSIRWAGAALASWQLIPGMVVASFAVSSLAGTITLIILGRVPPRHTGAASGVTNTMLQLGMAAGVAIVSVVFFGTLRAGRNIEAAMIASLAVEMLFFAAAVVASLLIPEESNMKEGSTAHHIHSGP